MMMANPYCRSSATAVLANNTNSRTVAAVPAAAASAVGTHTAEQLVDPAAVPVAAFGIAAAIPSTMTGNPTTSAAAVVVAAVAAPKEEEKARRLSGPRLQGPPTTPIPITLAISVWTYSRSRSVSWPWIRSRSISGSRGSPHTRRSSYLPMLPLTR